MNYHIRPITPKETPLLRDFLYNAIFIPEGVPRHMNGPRFQMSYVHNMVPVSVQIRIFGSVKPTIASI